MIIGHASVISCLRIEPAEDSIYVIIPCKFG
jgi:hypothetical protein